MDSTSSPTYPACVSAEKSGNSQQIHRRIDNKREPTCSIAGGPWHIQQLGQGLGQQRLPRASRTQHQNITLLKEGCHYLGLEVRRRESSMWVWM